MKRLVAAGLPRIVQIAKCWRAEESGPHHRGEFTMVEWYRANAPLETLADDCEALLRVAARAAGRGRGGARVSRRRSRARPCASCARATRAST